MTQDPCPRPNECLEQTSRSSVDGGLIEPIVCCAYVLCGALAPWQEMPFLTTDNSENFPVIKAFGYAAQDATTPLAPFSFERREPRENDVQIEILYCGVCHSDLHTAREEWGGTLYPCVPGHEIVGRVMRVGPGV